MWLWLTGTHRKCSFMVSASVTALSSFNNGRCDPVRWDESSLPLNDLSRVCYHGNGREARAGILSQIFKKRRTKVRTIKTPDGKLHFPRVHTCTYIACGCTHTQTHTHTPLVSFLFLWLNALRKINSWERDYSAHASRFQSIMWGNQGGRDLRELVTSTVSPERERMSYTCLLSCLGWVHFFIRT